MRPSRRRWLFRGLLVVLGLLAGWLAVEAGCYALLRLGPRSRPVGRFAFRSTRPAPYRDAAYFSPEFLDESMRCLRHETPTGASYLVPLDFAGRSINIAGGQRRTTDQPDVFDHRLLVFGGSTVFCAEVPDADTLPSCLQRALNATPGPRYRVENYGTSSMLARQQADRLAATELRPGDLVLFYDGVNDVYYPIFNGNPGGYRPGDSHDGGVRKLGGARAWLYPLCFRLGRYSYAAKYLFRNMDGPRPVTLLDEATLRCNLAAAEAGYRDALTRARDDARARGARFLHALQPHLFTVPEPTAYERWLVRNDLKALPGLDHAYRLGYPRLRQAAESASSLGVPTIDLTGTLDERGEGEEFYLDFCHVNHAANRRLADALCRAVRRLRPDG